MLVSLLDHRLSGQCIQTTYPFLPFRLLSMGPVFQLMSEPRSVCLEEPCF